MEDLRNFLDDIGGTDRVWAVQFGHGLDWLPVSACALSIPLTVRSNCRVLFYIDAGRGGRGHALRLSQFRKSATIISGLSLDTSGREGHECVLRGSERREWHPNMSQWFIDEWDCRLTQFEAAQKYIVSEYEIAEDLYTPKRDGDDTQ